MPKVLITRTGAGTIFPCEELESEKGSDVSVGLHPTPGHKVGALFIDGKPSPLTNLVKFPSIGSDHRVEVTFVKTCVGRTLEHTLSSLSSGILLKGTMVQEDTSCPVASLMVSLFNPSNHLSLSFSLGTPCAARFSTDHLAEDKRHTREDRSSAVPGTGSSFLIRVRGSAATVSVRDAAGSEILTSSFSLFSGDGAMLEHGWVVAVDGSASDGYLYPLDLQDFVVEADEKSPMLVLRDDGNRHSTDQQSRRYVGTI